MDLTVIGHALAAAAMQVVIGLLTGDYLTGGLIGCTFFLHGNTRRLNIVT